MVMLPEPTLTDVRVLVLTADDVEDIELLYPLYRLREEGAAVTLATLGGREVTGKRGHGPIKPDAATDDVLGDNYDALVIPGGYAPDKLRQDEHVLDLVRHFDERGKPLAFICHAGWVPISAGVLSGRRATSVRAIRDDMVNAGVNWEDSATVVDGHVISARVPADLGQWMRTFIGALDAVNVDGDEEATDTNRDPATQREGIEKRLMHEERSGEGAKVGQANP